MPPHATQKREDPDGQLPTWSGIPLEPENLGAFLPISTLFCQIGNPQQMEAILVIDQSEIELVRPGQKVDVKLEELPGRIFTGRITEIAPEALRVAPKALSTKYKGELATKTDPTNGVEHPMSTSYQARVPLEEPKDLLPLLRLGLTGQAKIYADPQTSPPGRGGSLAAPSISSCRERPPWRSGRWEDGADRLRRKSTEGVPYRAWTIPGSTKTSRAETRSAGRR